MTKPPAVAVPRAALSQGFAPDAARNLLFTEVNFATDLTADGT